MGKTMGKNIYIYIYIYSHTTNQQLKKKELIGWQLNGFHSCLIGEKESHKLEGSLNYYHIEFDGMVNGKLKSQEMLIKREREREQKMEIDLA